MVIRAEAKDVPLGIGSVMGLAQRLQMVNFRIWALWQVDSLLADLALVGIELLHRACKFRISKDSILVLFDTPWLTWLSNVTCFRSGCLCGFKDVLNVVPVFVINNMIVQGHLQFI